LESHNQLEMAHKLSVNIKEITSKRMTITAKLLNMTSKINITYHQPEEVKHLELLNLSSSSSISKNFQLRVSKGHQLIQEVQSITSKNQSTISNIMPYPVTKMMPQQMFLPDHNSRETKGTTTITLSSQRLLNIQSIRPKI